MLQKEQHMLHVVGQFGTGQFGTRTIWHQTFDKIKLNLIEHFWQHLGQKFSFEQNTTFLSTSLAYVKFQCVCVPCRVRR